MLSSLRRLPRLDCVRFLKTGNMTLTAQAMREIREIQYKVTKVVLGNDSIGGGYGRAYLENEESSGVHEVAVSASTSESESSESLVKWIPKNSKAFKDMQFMEKEWVVRKEAAHDLYDFVKEGDTVTLCRKFVECKILSDGNSKPVATGVLDHLIGYKILSDGVSTGLMDLSDCADKSDVYSPDPALQG